MRYLRIAVLIMILPFLGCGCPNEIVGAEKAAPGKTIEQNRRVQIPSASKKITKSRKTIPNNEVEIVKLQKLLENPKKYAEKEIVVKGVFNNICCPSDFNLKDGFDMINVFITDKCPMPSKSKVGSKMKVRGTVMTRGWSVALIAKEIMFE